jgi:hypothetical protein
MSAFSPNSDSTATGVPHIQGLGQNQQVLTVDELPNDSPMVNKHMMHTQHQRLHTAGQPYRQSN